MSAAQGFISSLNVNGLTIGTGNGFVDFSFVRAILFSSIQTNTALLYASSLTGDGSQIFNLNAVSSTQLQSTIIGLGTLGYISSAVASVNYLSTISTVNSTITSSLVGLGNLGYISSSQLISTVTGLGNIYISSAGAFQTGLTSSIIGLGTVGYVSTQSLYSSIQSYNFVSTASLQSTVIGLGNIYTSTAGGSITQSNINSSLTGLGSLGYLSSLIGTSASAASAYAVSAYLSKDLSVPSSNLTDITFTTDIIINVIIGKIIQSKILVLLNLILERLDVIKFKFISNFFQKL